ncbi:hypothetical protein IJH01_01630 [Candidatus Saccharibacteria bacterium]|nr:hypothetical protein [Candidatus Saccharibacteria bacterium]
MVESTLLEVGEVVVLDGRDFLCFERLELDGKDYLYLISTDDLADICFAEQMMVDGEPQIRTIGNKDTKLKLTAAFQAKYKKADSDS